MKIKLPELLILLLHSLPFAWLSIYMEAVYSQRKYYLLMFAGFVILGVLIVIRGNLRLMIAGNIFSYIVSYIMTYIVSIADKDWFFKPLTYNTRIIAPTLAAVFFECFALVIFVLLKPLFRKNQ